MRDKILIHDYAGHPFQAQLSRALAEEGREVVHAYAGGLLTPRGALQRQVGDADSLRFLELPMAESYRADKYKFLRRRRHEVEYGRRLADFVEEVAPDVVISGNTPTEPQWTMVQRANGLGIPVISWIQDFYSVAVDKLARRKLPVLGALAGSWYRRLDAKCFQASAGIVAITEDFVPILGEFGVPADRVEVIPNWAPLEELPLRPRDNLWRQKQGLGDSLVFLYSGTLAMKHNPSLLVALAEKFRDDPDVRIVVISEGPGAEYLQRQKEEGGLSNLLLLPFQPFEAMPEVLAAADVLISVLEADAGVFSVPSKVLTYLCAQRPILAAMPPNNLASRIVDREAAGLCVSPDDEAGFLTAARRLGDNENLRLAQGQAGRRYAEEAFDIERIADRFEAVIQRVSGLKKRAASSPIASFQNGQR